MLDISELASSAVPFPGVQRGVYFLFDDSELVYIGKGWNCFLRVGEHTTKKEGRKKFNSWNWIPVEDEGERRALEDRLIRGYRPKYNKLPSRRRSS